MASLKGAGSAFSQTMPLVGRNTSNTRCPNAQQVLNPKPETRNPKPESQ